MDIEANLKLSATGGDQAAGEVARINDSLQMFMGTNTKLQGDFARRFEHIGIKMFGADLLRTIGLGGEMRPMLMAMQTGVNALADSFGLAAGPLGLLVMGFTAAAAVGYKLVESHNQHKESLEKLLEKQQSEVQADHDLTDKLEAYKAAVGSLPPDLKRLSDAIDADTAAKLRNAQATAGQTLEAARRALQANEEETASLKARTAANLEANNATMGDAEAHVVNTVAIGIERDRLKTLSEAHAGLEKNLRLAESALEANSEGFASNDERLKKNTESANKSTESVNKLTEASAKLKLEQSKLQGEADKAFDGMRKDAQKYQIDLDKMWQEQDKKQRASFGLLETNSKHAGGIISSTFQSAATGVGMGFAKMIVEGKNFGESMKALGIEVAESLIADFVAMGIKWAVMQAYRVVTHATAQSGIQATETAALTGSVVANHIAAGAVASSWAFSAETAAAAWGAIVGGPPGSSAAVAAETAIVAPLATAAHVAAATGRDMMVDRPTMLWVGEGGEGERVTVTPKSKMGGRGGGGVSISFGDIIIQGVQDPRKIADQVALLITQAVRGRGQLSLVGPSIY